MRHRGPSRTIVALPLLWSGLLLAGAEPSARVAPPVVERIDATGHADVLVILKERARLRREAPAVDRREQARRVRDRLIDTAARSQRDLRAWLDLRGVEHRSYYVVNGIRLEADRELLEQLRRFPGVSRIEANPRVPGIVARTGLRHTDATDAPATVEWGVAHIGADGVWSDHGVRGEGITIGIADTGVAWTHLTLYAQYKGWLGDGVEHGAHWHDAIDGSLEPIDPHGHGTWVASIAVGDDQIGNQLGVAPAANWIGCRNMDATGYGMPSSYIECMEYFMAPYPPGGDPIGDGDPALAPHVVNNSWGCPPEEGCSADTLREAVEAVRAAGIEFVVAAGNAGPVCSTVNDPPAIYAASWSVGATDASDETAGFSSRGPVTVDGSDRRKPDVSAPGVNIRGAGLSGGFSTGSGTSGAAPHVAGALALWWSARPGLASNHDLARCTFEATSWPLASDEGCGGDADDAVPNNEYGWGRIDVLEAIDPSADGDEDSIVDACDCAPSSEGSFWPPETVGGVAWQDAIGLGWDDQSGRAGLDTGYQVVYGSLADLQQDGLDVLDGCSPTATADWTVESTPAPGEGWFYVIRADNGCGAGDWGEGTSGLRSAENWDAACTAE